MPASPVPSAAAASLAALWAFGGGLDDRGCHNGSSTGEYYCHQGPVDSRSFSWEAAATRTFEGSTSETRQAQSAGTGAYDRDLYGDCRDADGDCEDTRDEILAAQGRQIELSADGC